jgi:putative hydrolase of the HAD superfamily
LRRTIDEHHRRSREEGIEYPEVDIVEVWRDALRLLEQEGHLSAEPGVVDPARLAVEYEVRSNPVWPMPHALECLYELRRAGLALGIVSNAQFFTPELFPALLGGTLKDLGFDEQLEYYSYRHGRAKPGEYLYRRACETLAARKIHPHQALYVGNDMLNDMLPAGRVGFRTALFAGDARSLRLREGDPRVEGLLPDLVLTDLSQLAASLG